VVLLCLGALFLGVASKVLEGELLPVFEYHDDELAAVGIDRVAQAIEAKLDALALFNRDYAEWDETYRYVQAPESMPDFIENNMYEDYWAQLGIELMLLLGPDGSMVWGALSAAGGVETLTLDDVVLPLFSENPLLSSDVSRNSISRGLLDTPVGLMMIVSGPVTRTDRSGPSVGSFMVGSILSKARIEEIAMATDSGLAMFFLADLEVSDRVREVPAELDAMGERFLKGISGDQQFTLSLLRDLYGDPAAVVEITTDQRAAPDSEALVRRIMKPLSLGVAIFVMVSWLLLFLAVRSGRR
jgi:sensor domain CHASE-containing protein